MRPRDVEAPGAADDGGRAQRSLKETQPSAPSLPPTDAEAWQREVALRDKRVANARARAALGGVAIHVLADGQFLAAKWGWSRELPDIDAVERGLDQTLGTGGRS